MLRRLIFLSWIDQFEGELEFARFSSLRLPPIFFLWRTRSGLFPCVLRLTPQLPRALRSHLFPRLDSVVEPSVSFGRGVLPSLVPEGSIYLGGFPSLDYFFLHLIRSTLCGG